MSVVKGFISVLSNHCTCSLALSLLVVPFHAHPLTFNLFSCHSYQTPSEWSEPSRSTSLGSVFRPSIFPPLLSHTLTPHATSLTAQQVIHSLLKVVLPFMDPVTRAKLSFNQPTPFIPDEQLLLDFGGKLNLDPRTPEYRQVSRPLSLELERE